MSNRTAKLAGTLIREESGQTIVMFSLILVTLLAVAGFVVDLARAMIADNALSSGTIAAALAGASEMPNSDYVAVAQDYSSIDEYNAQTKTTTTGKNTSSMLPGVQTTAVGYCSNFVTSTLDVHCVTMGSNSVNALVVTQTVTVPMYFMQVVGIDSITFSSTQTAAWKGAARNPYNIAVIVDTTASMTSVDSGSEAPCNGLSRIACSLIGVQDLLANLTPCTGGASCGTGTSPLDEVSLYTFPGLASSTAVTDDVTCAAQLSSGGTSGSVATYHYGFPGSTFTGSALLPDPPIYQLVGFSTDYKSSDTTSALTSTSRLVEAVGGAGEANCKYNSSGGGGWGSSGSWAGIQAVGGAGTYYAGVVNQAQNDLYNQYETRLKAGNETSNVMAILSDGAANSSNSDMGSSSSSNSNSSGTYPSYKDECQQAITAAQAATDGTWPTSQSSASPVKTTIYTVAYGAESTGCTTDSSLSPCDTMEQMASSYLTDSANPTLDFYSDYVATGGDTSCTSDANSTTSIPAIFQDIASHLSASKIMANPPGCTAGNTAACD